MPTLKFVRDHVLNSAQSYLSHWFNAHQIYFILTYSVIVLLFIILLIILVHMSSEWSVFQCLLVCLKLLTTVTRIWMTIVCILTEWECILHWRMDSIAQRHSYIPVRKGFQIYVGGKMNELLFKTPLACFGMCFRVEDADTRIPLSLFTLYVLKPSPPLWWN